ncbi:MAG TPA: sigma-70 family RNA polymerase sigma factor, partial [Pilimelia sp.]|nr:sigma-70 family RNA polymerase sigma factor [Pilimelia sp.]
DVSQMVWLTLVENLHAIREPSALASWIGRTTRNFCLRLVGQHRRVCPLSPDDVQMLSDHTGHDPIDAWAQQLGEAERRQAVRAAVAELPPRCRRLWTMLLREPAASYSEIAAELGIPLGSLGPTRARCLEKLRRSPALAAVLAAEADCRRPEAPAGPSRGCPPAAPPGRTAAPDGTPGCRPAPDAAAPPGGAPASGGASVARGASGAGGAPASGGASALRGAPPGAAPPAPRVPRPRTASPSAAHRARDVGPVC